jgi:hypothetical protein
MPWDRSNGTDPKYRTKEHKAYRASLVNQLNRDGYLTCTAATCVMPTRTITNPNGRARDGLHAGHADNGIDYEGAQHAACNVSDGARRARAKQDEPKPMRLTPGITRPQG